jgi:diguanylate cyclase
VVGVEGAAPGGSLTRAASDRETDGSAPPETASIGTTGDCPDVWKAVHQALRGEAIKATQARTPLSLVILRIEDTDRLNDSVGLRLRELLGGAARAVQADTDPNGLPWIYGTDRFVFLLPDTELAAAQDKLATIRACIADLGSAGRDPSAHADLAVSIGAAQYTPGESLGHFIQRAIDALAPVERAEQG